MIRWEHLSFQGPFFFQSQNHALSLTDHRDRAAYTKRPPHCTRSRTQWWRAGGLCSRTRRPFCPSSSQSNQKTIPKSPPRPIGCPQPLRAACPSTLSPHSTEAPPHIEPRPPGLHFVPGSPRRAQAPPGLPAGGGPGSSVAAAAVAQAGCLAAGMVGRAARGAHSPDGARRGEARRGEAGQVGARVPDPRPPCPEARSPRGAASCEGHGGGCRRLGGG